MRQIQTKFDTQSDISHQNSCYLLFDPQLLAQPAAGLLQSGLIEKADTFEKISSGGRGQAWFVQLGKLQAVYRCYLRGGLVARLNKQTYMGRSIEQSRSFKEFRLLQWMLQQGLPVPRPIAASVCRWPLPISPLYRAHILVERIPDVKTLDEVLQQQTLEPEQWKQIGICIRQFHKAGVYHADLNANNILIDKNKEIYLIDFDKCEKREADVKHNEWQQKNLQRLNRSLLKQQQLNKRYFFSAQEWGLLESSYKSN